MRIFVRVFLQKVRFGHHFYKKRKSRLSSLYQRTGYYTSETVLENTVVNYTICKKSDMPDSVLQKEKMKFGAQELYFCIIKIVALG